MARVSAFDCSNAYETLLYNIVLPEQALRIVMKKLLRRIIYEFHNHQVEKVNYTAWYDFVVFLLIALKNVNINKNK